MTNCHDCFMLTKCTVQSGIAPGRLALQVAESGSKFSPTVPEVVSSKKMVTLVPDHNAIVDVSNARRCIRVHGYCSRAMYKAR